MKNKTDINNSFTNHLENSMVYNFTVCFECLYSLITCVYYTVLLLFFNLKAKQTSF